MIGFVERFCGCKVSGREKIIANITALASAISQNIPRQEPNSSIASPNNGPATQAIAMMITSVESICAACELPKRSLCILRFWLGSTSVLRTHPRPEIRAKKSAAIASDIAQPTEPIANSDIPMKSGILRQVLSLIGPQTSCMVAKPIKKPVIVSSESPCSCRSVVGIAGRYTSAGSARTP